MLKKNSNEITSQEQSTDAPTVSGEDNGVEQPVAELVKTNELNEGTEPSKDNKGAGDEPENAKDDGDRDVKD